LKETRARTFIFIEPEPRQRKPAANRADSSVREHLWFFMSASSGNSLWTLRLWGMQLLLLSQGCGVTHCGGVRWWHKDISCLELHLVRSKCLKLSHRPLLWTSSWVLAPISTPGTRACGMVRRSTDMRVRQAWILICISLTYSTCELGLHFLIHKLVIKMPTSWEAVHLEVKITDSGVWVWKPRSATFPLWEPEPVFLCFSFFHCKMEIIWVLASQDYDEYEMGSHKCLRSAQLNMC